MRTFWKYIAHFWYVAVNWNIWMAFFMVYDNVRGALKYGGGTFIPVELKQLTITKGDLSKSSRYEPVSYYMLEHLFSALHKLSQQTSIVDLGCGKGRMMMVAPSFGFTSVTGIDFARELCDRARENMRKKEREFPDLQWKVLNENVEDYVVRPEDSVFFMFNPFTEPILRHFIKKVNASCNQFPRVTYFIYASPQHRQLLLENGYAIVYQKHKMHLESIIAVRDHDPGS